jgi:hypothetical protein
MLRGWPPPYFGSPTNDDTHWGLSCPTYTFRFREMFLGRCLELLPGYAAGLANGAGCLSSSLL